MNLAEEDYAAANHWRSLKRGAVTPDPRKLLVVDDNLENRDLLSHRLIHLGYEVEIAENGAQALAKIHKAHYDLVLLDHMMPGMSGLDLLRLLRATYSPSQLPVIIVSGVGDSDSIVDAFDQGVNDYVVKPVDMPVMDARSGVVNLCSDSSIKIYVDLRFSSRRP